jgi:hypothetical protein
MTLIAVTVWLVAVGCAPLVSSPTGKVKKRTQHFSSALAIPDYSVAVGHCTKTAVWKKTDSSVLPIGEFFRSLNDIKNKRDFAINVTGSKVISATKIVIACDMRQQVQVGIVDVGNVTWTAQVTWEKASSGDWRISEIKDMSGQVTKKSK